MQHKLQILKGEIFFGVLFETDFRLLFQRLKIMTYKIVNYFAVIQMCKT